jgi:hypothetical protein
MAIDLNFGLTTQFLEQLTIKGRICGMEAAG